MTHPRRFRLIRDHDITGVTGTGTVAHGVQWPDGTVTVRWSGSHASTVQWNSIENALHIHGHDGATRIEWADPDPAMFNDTCPHCIDGHRHPDTVTWGTRLRAQSGSDRLDQIVVMHTDGGHICEGDAWWVFQTLNHHAEEDR